MLLSRVYLALFRRVGGEFFWQYADFTFGGMVAISFGTAREQKGYFIPKY